MKIIRLSAAAALGIFFLAGCSDNVTQSNDNITENVALNLNIAAYPAETEIVTFQLTPSETDGDTNAPDYESYYDNDVCYNVTPADITESYGMTVYKFNQSCASILLYDGEYYTLGICFGGFGADSFAIADLNGDGCEELYFTFSWGSGMHRSQVGYFDTADKTVRTYEYSNFLSGGNWFAEMVLTAEDGKLYVHGADIEINSCVDILLTPEEKIGELIFDGGEIVLNVETDGETFSPVIFSLTD